MYRLCKLISKIRGQRSITLHIRKLLDGLGYVVRGVQDYKGATLVSLLDGDCFVTLKLFNGCFLLLCEVLNMWFPEVL